MLTETQPAFNDFEAKIFEYRQQHGYEDPEDAFVFQIEEIYDVLLVVLEAAGMPSAREHLVQCWDQFKSKPKGLHYVDCYPQFDTCISPPLKLLKRIITGLRITITNEITSEDAWKLSTLRSILEDTAGLLLKRGISPSNELELQGVMHDYLSACFPDFRLNPPIGGSIKNFLPDCGVSGLGAAIEFKIAHTMEQAITSFTGIVEDVGGYKGSKDWTRFYAVMYQAKPFIRKSQIQEDFKRIGAATWTAILINGDTKPRLNFKKGAKKKIPKTNR